MMLLVLLACCAAVAPCSAVPAAPPSNVGPVPPPAAVETSLATQAWTHIPGPTPILHTDPHGCGREGCNSSNWAGGTLEMAGGVHKDLDKYYLFFHASPERGPYRMGVAVATSPLGPFRMSPANPILTEGKNGSWDDYWVASGNPFRRKAGDWIMLFSARCGGEFGKRECDGGGIGLAYAQQPEGPWTKHPTPVINRAQGGVPAYVASVVFAKNEYHLYCENETAADMGYFAHWYVSILQLSIAPQRFCQHGVCVPMRTDSPFPHRHVSWPASLPTAGRRRSRKGRGNCQRSQPSRLDRLVAGMPAGSQNRE